MKHDLSLHTVNRDGTWRRLTKSYQIFGIQRDFYSDVYTILNRIEFDMDHMRISGTEPSSVKQSSLKYEKWCQKCQNNVTPKGMV